MSNVPDAFQIIEDLLFSYMSKDEDFPHSFEVDAVSNAVDYLTTAYESGANQKVKFTTESLEKWKNMIKEKAMCEEESE